MRADQRIYMCFPRERVILEMHAAGRSLFISLPVEHVHVIRAGGNEQILTDRKRF